MRVGNQWRSNAAHFRVAYRSVELVGDVKLYEVASINNPKPIV